MSEWSINSTEVFFCKTSAFSSNYILNEIQGMTLAVLYKYINCTVDKLLALALVTNFITNYSIIIIIIKIIMITTIATIITKNIINIIIQAY